MKTSIFQLILGLAAPCIAGFLFVSTSETGSAQAQEQVLSVCALVQNAARYENQIVLVESTVLADEHATVLEGQGCRKGVYLAYPTRRTGEKWKALDDALAAKSSGLDRRVLHVEVRGIYHSDLKAYRRNIRQLEVTEVLDVRFEVPEKPTGNQSNMPSAMRLNMPLTQASSEPHTATMRTETTPRT